jgi:octaprenyl-diphosphate synthase
VRRSGPGVTLPLEAALHARLGRLIGEELRTCEAEIQREIAASPVPMIRDLTEYVALAGGKRLRPILVLLCARLVGGSAARAARLGCVVELLHTATLMHDDVVDRAPLRRGRPSANARWGDDAALLVGDHLYARCMALLVADRDLAVMDALAAAMVSMTEAEVFQLERKRDGQLTEVDYLRIIREKTATFMSACCRIGGLIGGRDGGEVEALAAFGEHLGIAFQIIDDSLDFDADEARLGKAIGADLREGKRTLPLIATLERAQPEERTQILEALRRPALAEPDAALDERDVVEVIRLVKRYDGVGYAVARAGTYAAQATAGLGRFPASEEREVLGLIAEYVVQRDR